MPLKRYGVLKGRPIGRKLATGSSPHYQIHLIDQETDYRIAINVKSQENPSELEFLVADNFKHPLTTNLPNLSHGFTPLLAQPGGQSLDYIRGNLFDPGKMRPLPFNLPGPNNDLNDLLEQHIQRALGDESALVYAFGEPWGPETHKKDAYFGFLPGNGIHDIHMNQGNSAGFADQDGVWQDGGLLIHFPDENRWVAVFLKFQSQTWHTDDHSGHQIKTPEPIPGVPGQADLVVQIVAALVNPVGPAPEHETVTLLNTSAQNVDLTGWAIADRLKTKQTLSGLLKAGDTVRLDLKPEVQLGNKGGLITLLNKNGLKVHGVSYTAEQVQKEGWTIVF